jgi:hypothetical protein
MLSYNLLLLLGDYLFSSACNRLLHGIPKLLLINNQPIPQSSHYLLPWRLSTDCWMRALVPFLVTRRIYHRIGTWKGWHTIQKATRKNEGSGSSKTLGIPAKIKES